MVHTRTIPSSCFFELSSDSESVTLPCFETPSQLCQSPQLTTATLDNCGIRRAYADKAASEYRVKP